MAGRKPWDAVIMFKVIVLCEPYKLSDDRPAPHNLQTRMRGFPRNNLAKAFLDNINPCT